MNTLLLPVLFAQGMWVRRITPRLPDASGPIEGTIEGKSPQYDLIVLGESTVAGIGAPTHEFALTGQTARYLAARTGRMVNWLALGRSGADARTACLQLTPKLAGRRADGVVIALGVNDTTGLTSAKRWSEDIRCLVTAIRHHLGEVRIVIAGPPPLGSFPAFPKLLKTFLGAQSKVLDQALWRLVPTMHNVIHAPMIESLNEHHFCEDKFHPSVAGYATWGDYLSRFLV